MKTVLGKKGEINLPMKEHNKNSAEENNSAQPTPIVGTVYVKSGSEVQEYEQDDKELPHEIILEDVEQSADDALTLKLRLRRLLRPKVFHVSTQITDKGLHFELKRGSAENAYEVIFPEEVWKEFPYNLKLMLRDNLAHLSFLDLSILFNAKKINYDTPLPLFKSFFTEVILKNLLFYGDTDSVKTVDYITRLCNLEFSFRGTHSPPCLFATPTKERGIITLTFGKESLLGFGVAKEIGIDPIPVTVVEPDLNTISIKQERIMSFENKHKDALIPVFEKEFNTKVYKINNQLGEIRCYANWGFDETDLGWSNILTQYLFYLLPFNYNFSSKYMIFGNENDECYYYTKEGFRCNPSYEQTREWMRHMNTMLHNITQGSVQATSLVQPLQEIAVCKVLYQRYPELAKYQISCPDGAEDRRWCGKCSKCAHCFIFMKALGFDNESVNLQNMLTLEHRDLFTLFSDTKDGKGYYSMGLARDEQLFAFHLAAKRGAIGDLIDIFKEQFAEEAATRETELQNDFFKVSRPSNIPTNLWRKLKPIFEEELAKE